MSMSSTVVQQQPLQSLQASCEQRAPAWTYAHADVFDSARMHPRPKRERGKAKAMERARAIRMARRRARAKARRISMPGHEVPQVREEVEEVPVVEGAEEDLVVHPQAGDNRETGSDILLSTSGDDVFS